MENELKPCPFCGGKAKFVVKSTESGNGKVGFGFAIQCSKCHLTHPNTVDAVRMSFNENGEIEIVDDGRGFAKSEWNRRCNDGT